METYLRKKSDSTYLEYGFRVLQFLRDRACLERLRRSFTTRIRTCGKLYDMRKSKAIKLAVPLGSGFNYTSCISW